MFREVLHFCSKISSRLNFDTTFVLFRLKMKADFDIVCDCLELLGVLFLMLFLEVHFLSLRSSKYCFWGAQTSDLTRETTSPAKDRMVETKNEKSRKR